VHAVDAAAEVRVRALLKRALRSFALRCVRAEVVAHEPKLGGDDDDDARSEDALDLMLRAEARAAATRARAAALAAVARRKAGGLSPAVRGALEGVLGRVAEFIKRRRGW
jgi:hypothetical protein